MIQMSFKVLSVVAVLFLLLLGALVGPVREDDRLSDRMRKMLQDAGVNLADVEGAHPVEADLFHPDARSSTPALGGRIIEHIPSQPANLCYPIENSAVTHWILRDIHAPLLRLNMESWEYETVLAVSYDIEDTVILKGGRTAGIVYGKVEDGGEVWIVTSGSSANPRVRQEVPKAEVESVERGTVFTFHLRDDVVWHDGHPFDAADVVFSMQLYGNPYVDCDKIRSGFADIVDTELIDATTVRFFYKEQYFQAMETFGETFVTLPRHLYDLHDPDHVDHDPDADEEALAAAINDNPHNIDWVGLGPYRMTTWERGQYIEAERFEDYFKKDPAEVGYADFLRWRYISDDDLAFEALLNEELDIFARIKTEDYFGQLTQQEIFTEKFYKAYTYTGAFGYTCWNLHRSKFKDPRVRTALALAFPTDEWTETKYLGLAMRVTGSMFFMTPSYDLTVEPVPYDPLAAEDLLAEAGWYDRNGNGIVDKDGEEMIIEWLMPSGNKASEANGQKMQEAFQQIGVRLEIKSYEWATFLDRIYNRDFDAANLAWVLEGLESDPKQLWHGDNAKFELRSSNRGLNDPECDRLIDAGRRELDQEKRYAIWHQLQRRIYELQPYMFSQNPPRKVGFNKNLRGVKLYIFSPGYRMRDMYYEEGTPGTRPLPAEFAGG